MFLINPRLRFGVPGANKDWLEQVDLEAGMTSILQAAAGGDHEE